MFSVHPLAQLIDELPTVQQSRPGLCQVLVSRIARCTLSRMLSCRHRGTCLGHLCLQTLYGMCDTTVSVCVDLIYSSGACCSAKQVYGKHYNPATPRSTRQHRCHLQPTSLIILSYW